MNKINRALHQKSKKDQEDLMKKKQDILAQVLGMRKHGQLVKESGEDIARDKLKEQLRAYEEDLE